MEEEWIDVGERQDPKEPPDADEERADKILEEPVIIVTKPKTRRMLIKKAVMGIGYLLWKNKTQIAAYAIKRVTSDWRVYILVGFVVFICLKMYFESDVWRK